MEITRNGPTLVLAGDFDVRSTGEVRNAIYDHLDGDYVSEHPEHAVAIDLSGVDHVDLTALRVIAAASRVAAQSGRRVVLRGACPAVRRMLHLSHLIRVVELEREPISA
ncbi:MAG TPA: STAS domain-containing protein [Nocardioides sp.]|nr:STAS domain-containing protein [Nocardioides sp.]